MKKIVVTERTYNSIQKDHASKKLLVSKTFLVKAGRYGTKEALAMDQIMKEYPDYAVEIKISQREKNSYKDLTIEKMARFLAELPEKADALAEFKNQLAIAEKIGANKYPTAKKWFLNNYGDLYNNKSAEDKFNLDEFIEKAVA